LCTTAVLTRGGREISHAKFSIPQLRISYILNLFGKAYTEYLFSNLKEP